MPIFLNQPALLAGFVKGEPHVLSQVYRAYVLDVRHVLRLGAGLRVAGDNGPPRGPELDDLTQEVFARAFSPRTRALYDGQREYRPYLLQIARNLLIDRWRLRQRQIRTEPLGQVDDLPMAAADPERHDLLRTVERSLAGVPPRLRDLYARRFVVGMTQERAARAMGISRQTVRTLELELKQRLWSALHQEEGDEQLVSPPRETTGARHPRAVAAASISAPFPLSKRRAHLPHNDPRNHQSAAHPLEPTQSISAV